MLGQLGGLTCDAVVLDASVAANPAVAEALALSRMPHVVVSPLGTEPPASTTAALARRGINSPIKPALLQAALLELLEPRAPQATSAAPAPVPATSPLAQRLPLKILVTDDNVINRKVATRMLQQMGYASDLASNGAEALAALEKNSYDLVFMDVQMPGLDGLETTRRIRDLERRAARPAVKVIAMTANAMLGDRDKCLAAGMDDYLAKPVRPEALQAALIKWGSRPGCLSPVGVPPAVFPILPKQSTGGAPVGRVAAGPAAPLTPEPPPVADSELVDLDRLVEFSGGSRTSLIEITDMFVSQTSTQLQSLQAALDLKDAAAIVRIAHSSAGACGVCGILGMESLFRRTEELGKQNRVADTAPLIAQLRANFARVKTCLLNSRQNLPLS